MTCQYRHPFLKQRNEKGCKRKTTNGSGGYHKIKRRRYDEEVILLPDKFVGKLLGHRGCRINELKANCSAFINVSRSGDLVHYDKREISIRGSKFDINEAKRALYHSLLDVGIEFMELKPVEMSHSK